MRRALELLIGGSAGHGLVEVNFIAVEVGAVRGMIFKVKHLVKVEEV